MSGYGNFKVIEGRNTYEGVQFLVIDGCTGDLKLHRHTTNKTESSYFSITEDAIIKNSSSYDRFGLKISYYEDGQLFKYHVNCNNVEDGAIHVDIKNKRIHLKNVLKHYISNVFFQKSIDFKDLVRIESTNRYEDEITQKDLQLQREQHILNYHPE